MEVSEVVLTLGPIEDVFVAMAAVAEGVDLLIA